MKRPRFYTIALVAAILILLPLFFLPQQPQLPGENSTLTLKAPSFVLDASAATSPIGTKLDSEAGISAYYQTPSTILLSQVRGQFRVIEQETADYILGSVAVPNYVEQYDVHVYVHKDGWILAYYLKDDPVSKIADVQANTTSTTLLKTVVSAIAGAAGAPFTDVTYYDFRYPNATNILFVGEDYDSGNDFTITLPSAYGYFERGFALEDSYSYDYFTVDGTDMPRDYWNGSVGYGRISSSLLLPDTPHKITVDDYGVLVIVYRVQ